MMHDVFNAMVVVIGTVSFAGACALIIAPPLTKYWTRRWLRERLGTCPLKTVRPDPPHEPTISSDHDITDFLDAVARDMRSGFSLASSFVQCSDRQSDSDHWSQPIAQRLLRGVTLSDAIVECTDSSWSQQIRFACRTLAVASVGGTGVAPALEHCASVLREQQSLELDRNVQSSQALLSTKVLTWLPIAVFVWICITDPIARLFLLSTPVGICCVALGVTLNVSGRRWMTNVVNRIPV